MGRFDNLKATIDANINTNGNQAITGAKLNSIMKQTVDSVDAQFTELSAEISSFLFEQGNVSYGNEVANTAVYRSLYIPCKQGDVINGKTYRVKVFDDNYQYLAEEGSTLSGKLVDYVVENANCAYVRIIILARDKDDCQILVNGVNALHLINKGYFDANIKIKSDLTNAENDFAKKTQVYDYALDLLSFGTEDYEQGFYTSGVGFTQSVYAITSQTYPINKGDIISVMPNGASVELNIINEDTLTFTKLKNIPNIVDNLKYTSEYDGLLRLTARNGGYEIIPGTSNVACSIRRAENVSEDATEVETEENIVKSVLDKVPVQVINSFQDGENLRFNNAEIIDAENELYPKLVRINNGYVRCLYSNINIKDNHLTIRMRINRLDDGGEILVKVGNLSDSSKLYTYNVARTHVNTILGLWQEYTIPYLSYQIASEGVDFKKVDDIFIVATNAEVDVQYIGIKRNPLKKGIVTFTFDDGYTTQMDAAKAMAKKGVTGTYYVIKNAIDGNSEGYMTIPQLQQMAESYNSDIQVHGGSPFDNETDESLVAIFRDTQQLLRENGISNGDHMSYPNGYHSERVVRLSRQFFKSCRTILYTIPIETYPPYDRFRMRSVSAIMDSQVAKIKEYIDRCVENGTWLILTFHKMEPAPQGASDQSMYCSMPAFEEILNYACEKANVMSISEVMNTSYQIK